MGLGSGPAAMKCLCLHGRGQDAEIFSQRLRSLVRKATGKLQFVFMRAAPRLAGCTQHLCHELNYAAMRAPRRRTPISTALCCDGTVLLPLSAGQQVPMRAWSVPEDLGVVRDTWQAHAAAGAPFDGIVAFSQARLWRRALGYDRFVLLRPRSKGAYSRSPFQLAGGSGIIRVGDLSPRVLPGCGPGRARRCGGLIIGACCLGCASAAVRRACGHTRPASADGLRRGRIRRSRRQPDRRRLAALCRRQRLGGASGRRAARGRAFLCGRGT